MFINCILIMFNYTQIRHYTQVVHHHLLGEQNIQLGWFSNHILELSGANPMQSLPLLRADSSLMFVEGWNMK
jgi:hypothetical protein